MKVSLRGRLRPVFFAQRGQVSEKGSFQPIPNRKFILFNFLGSLEEAGGARCGAREGVRSRAPDGGPRGPQSGAGLAARMRGLGGCEAGSEQSMGVLSSAPELRFPGAL